MSGNNGKQIGIIKRRPNLQGWGSENDPVRKLAKEKSTFWFKPSNTPPIKDNGRNNPGKTFY